MKLKLRLVDDEFMYHAIDRAWCNLPESDTGDVEDDDYHERFDAFYDKVEKALEPWTDGYEIYVEIDTETGETRVLKREVA